MQAEVTAARFRFETAPRKNGSAEFRVIFSNCPFAVRQALASTMNGLVETGLSEDDSVHVELVLAEALNNVCEHAYPDNASGIVEMRLIPDPTCLRCEIVDTGRALPPGEFPGRALPDVEVDRAALPEGGFGWFLIRTLSTGISYDSADSRNTLSFSIELARRIRSV